MTSPHLKPLASYIMTPSTAMCTCQGCGMQCHMHDMTDGLCPDCYLEAREQRKHEQIEIARIRRF